MAYIPNEWKDQVVQRPKTYQMNNNDDGSVTLVDSFGLVTELGTPVNQDYMNHIEQGIAGCAIRYYSTTETFKKGEWAKAEVEGVQYIYESLVDENTGSPLTDETKWKLAAIGANSDLSNLSAEGEKHFLNKSQITNCLLEVPQRINVELNNGALTLKAGSVVIVPYGTSAPALEVGDPLNGGEIVDISWDGEKLFYFVKYDEDKVHSIGSTAGTFQRGGYITSSGSFSSSGFRHIFSGSTAPTEFGNGYAVWYDTENNIVKFTSNSGSTWESYFSLPLTLVNQVDGVVVSIDTVFNGFGFIGSTEWCDKGVKGLAPDGRNSDGSLKNIEFETEYVTTKTRTWTVGAGQSQYATISAATKGINAIISSYYFEQEEKPDITGHVLWFNTRENVMYWQNNDNTWIKVNDIKVFNINNTQAYTDGKIDSISEVKQVFRAADYSAHPQITETYSNGASWYRVYSDGWCEQGGTLTTTPSVPSISGNANITFLKNFANINYSFSVVLQATSSDYARIGTYDYASLSVSGIIGNCLHINANGHANYAVNMLWRAAGYIS